MGIDLTGNLILNRYTKVNARVVIAHLNYERIIGIFNRIIEKCELIGRQFILTSFLMLYYIRYWSLAIWDGRFGYCFPKTVNYFDEILAILLETASPLSALNAGATRCSKMNLKDCSLK